MNLRHGFSRNGSRRSEYGTWLNMRQRCSDRGHIEYLRYGAKGIRVCARWQKSFSDFIEDMGEAPSQKHQIDRINGKGNYTPKNCRWVTSKEQQRNRSDNRRITAQGKTLTLSEWDESLGFPVNTVGARIRRGMSIDLAISQPLRITSRTAEVLTLRFIIANSYQ